MNAIMNKNSADLKGCTLYVALFPCNECAKLVIQAGIRLVVYVSDKVPGHPSFIGPTRFHPTIQVVIFSFQVGCIIAFLSST